MAPGNRIFSTILATGVVLRHQRRQRHQHSAPRLMANVAVEANTVVPPAA